MFAVTACGRVSHPIWVIFCGYGRVSHPHDFMCLLWLDVSPTQKLILWKVADAGWLARTGMPHQPITIFFFT